jgi:hypothetical protein
MLVADEVGIDMRVLAEDNNLVQEGNNIRHMAYRYGQ